MNWTEQQKIQELAEGRFGGGVAISGTTAAVAAPGTGATDAGKVFVYLYNSVSGDWEEQQEIVSADPYAEHIGQEWAYKKGAIALDQNNR